MKRVCVFCGSCPGSKPAYSRAAAALGRLLAQRRIGLVYGGGKVGLMGQVARAALRAGGKVTGVIPRNLLKQRLAFTDVADIRVVATMHERKALMSRLSDGFIALPGGIGTFDEFFEALTWAQLGLHRKPCGILDVGRYYAPLLALLDHCVKQGFMCRETRAMVLVDTDPARLLDKFARYQPPVLDKAALALKLSELES
ncbi:MAG: TIGR00730 family Rossman fold protein [Elusimicrobia bacterium]|nr:TIGR00730 family Rossman fold protein [Elusimicrobiota bacterium]